MALVLKSNKSFTGNRNDLPYRYIFDGIELDCLVGCSQMKPDYKGALMRVTRLSDNAEMDVFAEKGKYINEEEILTFSQGSDVKVRTLYDQTGNNNNFGRADITRQPFLIKDGSFQYDEDGLPAIKFDEGNQALVAFDITLAETTGIGFYIKAAFTGFVTSVYDDVRGVEAQGFRTYGTKNIFRYKSSDTDTALKTIDLAGTINTPSVIKTYINASTSQFTHSVNGVGGTQAITYTQLQKLNRVPIGSGRADYLASDNMRGLFSTMAVFSSKNTADALL